MTHACCVDIVAVGVALTAFALVFWRLRVGR
jgi:hypothetical protein